MSDIVERLRAGNHRLCVGARLDPLRVDRPCDPCSESLDAADEIERLRALVRNVAQVDPRCTGDDDYAVCAFCGGGQLERDEQSEPNRVVTDHHEWTYGGSRDAIIWPPRWTYSRVVRIEHEADCPWLACRQEFPC